MIIAKYKLKRDFPNLSAGSIFEHRAYDSRFPDRGNPGHGCLILGWIDGMCQNEWCGETYILPGQLARNKEWFEKIENYNEKEITSQVENLKRKIDLTLKEQLLKEIAEMKRKIEWL